jgi:hypothetical protein
MTINEVIKNKLIEVPEITFFAYNSINNVLKLLPEKYISLLRLPKETEQIGKNNYANSSSSNETFILFKSLKKDMDDSDGMKMEEIQNDLMEIFLKFKDKISDVLKINQIVRWYYYKTNDLCIILEFTAIAKDYIIECDGFIKYIE